MLQSIQICRAVAAALVVLFHLGGTFAQDKYFGFKALDGPFAWGDAGVDFFFVLSGFLITLLHRHDFGRPQALGAYLWKRLVRIFPSYWLVCAALLAAAWAVPSLRAALPGDPAELALALALWPQDPALVGGTGSPILFVAWSLQYELLFYALVAVLIAHRAAGVVAVAAVLLAVAGCRFADGCAFPLSFVGSPMVLLFGMGAAGAVVLRSRWVLPAPLWLAAATAAAFVGFGLFESAVEPEALMVDPRLVFGALASIVIVALASAEERGELVLVQRWPQLLGDASYALYLVHIPVISVLAKGVLALKVVEPAALVAAFGLIFAACVAVAIGFHRLVEKPLLGWLHGVGATLAQRRGSRPMAAGRAQRSLR